MCAVVVMDFEPIVVQPRIRPKFSLVLPMMNDQIKRHGIPSSNRPVSSTANNVIGHTASS